VAEKGQVVIRPMMYLALSYDHRVVDGKEAVTFLIPVNDCIQNPMQLLLALERRRDDGSSGNLECGLGRCVIF
jgi:hypothetical protein